MKLFIFFLFTSLFTCKPGGLRDFDYVAVKLPDVPFPGRDSGVSAILGNYAYMMTGWNPDLNPDLLNDMWRYSNAGWEYVGQTPFSRSEPACVVLNNKIWVLGGNYTGDSWSFEPATGWTLEDSNITFLTNRNQFFYGVTDDNCILIVGGVNASGWLDEVWKSDSTGHNFQLVLKPTPFGVATTGCGKMPKLNGELGILGGGLAYNHFSSNIWTTKDGISWTKKGPLPFKSWWPNAEVYEGNVWLIGGHVKIPRQDVNTTYYSNDWITWTEFSAPYPARHAGTLFSIGDVMYYTTGRSQGVMIQDMWRFERHWK